MNYQYIRVVKIHLSEMIFSDYYKSGKVALQKDK
jgi:hypothetical protein